MIQTSDAYKAMMKKPIRNRGYISISLGVINQNAQGNASLDENVDRKSYSRGNLFNSTQNNVTYGTLEENFTKADGKFVFLPRNDQYMNNGLVVEVGEPIVINLGGTYDIKGLTLEFLPTSYPTALTIESDEETITVSDNTEYLFTTLNVLGDTTQITITPTAMSGGNQYVHLKHILMGVGVAFSDDTIEEADMQDFISGISVEASYKELAVSAYDTNSQFDVDNESAFINYLEQGQPISVSFGVDLDDGTQEWFQVLNCRLKEWSSQKGRVRLRATDLLTQSEKLYSHLTNTERTAKSEFEAIFADMGLTPADYHIDDYLGSQTIKNPIEEISHRDCLQLLANATRAIVYEDENGVIQVKGSFNRNIQELSAPYYTNMTAQTDEFGKTVYASTKVASNSGVFSDISSTNLFDPLDEFNTIEWLGADPVKSWNFPDLEYDGNYVIVSEPAVHPEMITQGNLHMRIKCRVGSQSFPIKEAGWYCVRSENRYYYKNDNYPYYAKMGDGLLQSELGTPDRYGTIMYFNFYVSQDDLYAGDLEIGASCVFGEDPKPQTIAISKGRTGEAYNAQVPYQKYYLNEKRPKVQLRLLNHYNYDKGAWIKFASPFPKEVSISRTWAGGSSTEIRELDSDILYYFYDDNNDVNSVTVEVTKGVPGHRAIIEEATAISEYTPPIEKSQMYEDPLGIQGEKVKDIKVRIFTYELVDGEYRQVDDEVYFTKTINSTGTTKIVENPMIYSSAQAELVAEWMASYYAQNVSYDVEYTGDPTIQANDLMYLESDYRARNIVDVEKASIKFNGAFKGSLELKRMPPPT